MESFLTRLDHAPRRARIVLGGAMVLLVTLGAALAIRDGSRLKSLDEAAFLDLTTNLALHGTFAHTNRPDIEGFDPLLPPGALRPTAYRAPGYVWLLVPFLWLGGGLVLLRTLNAVLLALTLWLLHGLLVRRGGPLAGMLGVGLVLLYPVLLFAAGMLYPQTLSAFLLVAAVRQLDALHPGAAFPVPGLLGLTLGLLVLTVPIHLLLLPILLAWLLAARRGTAWQAALVLAVVVALVGAWMVRNAVVLGAPVVATSSGFNLLAGNGPYVRHDQGTGDLRWPRGVREEVAGQGEVERDRILTRAALRWVAGNPADAARLYLRKLLHWFALRNEVVSDRVMPGGSGAGPPWLRDLVMMLGYGLLLGLLLLRLLLARRHPLSPLEVLLLALYLGAALAYAVYFTRIRFRVPFDWLLVALGALLLSRVRVRQLLARPGAEGV